MLWNTISASIKRRNRRGAPQRSVRSQIEESGLLSQTPDSFLKRGVSFLKSRILFSKEAFHFSKNGLAQKPRAEPRISKDQFVLTCRHLSHANCFAKFSGSLSKHQFRNRRGKFNSQRHASFLKSWASTHGQIFFSRFIRTCHMLPLQSTMLRARSADSRYQ